LLYQQNHFLNRGNKNILVQHQNVKFYQQNIWLLQQNFWLQQQKKIFVAPNFVAVTKLFFSVHTQKNDIVKISIFIWFQLLKKMVMVTRK